MADDLEETMTWHGICSVCGEPVAGGTDNGTLEVPADSQTVVCLACLCLYGDDEGNDE